jgi:hypothetical protein
MACLDDLVSATQSLAYQLSQQSNCGCGAGGAGGSEPAALELDTGDITQETGTPPDGYSDWSSYQSAKCDVATWIVNNLLTDVQWMQVNLTISIVVAALAAGLVGFLPATVLVAILGVALVIGGLELSWLENLEDAVRDGFDDLVCALVTGTNADDSQDQFEAELSTQVDAQIADPVARYLLKTIAGYWANFAALNLLYAPEAEVLAMSSITPAQDCSSCGLDCNNFFVVLGEYLGGNTFGSVFSGDHVITVYFNDDAGLVNCSGICGPEENFTITNLSGWTLKTSSLDSFRIWQDSDCPITGTNATVYSSDTQPDSSVRCGRRVTIFGDTAFQVDLTRSGVC